MWQSLIALFSTDKVLDIIERFANDGMTAKEKADFLIEYQKVTRHQSKSRRVIALAITAVWCTMVFAWLFFGVLNSFLELEQLRMLANNIKMFMLSIILEPFNLIVMFYFGIHAVTRLKK